MEDSVWIYGYFYNKSWVELPKGTIEILIGRELTWNDEPVEISVVTYISKLEKT